MVLVGDDVIDPESEGTKSGAENARRRLMFSGSETPPGENQSDKKMINRRDKAKDGPETSLI